MRGYGMWGRILGNSAWAVGAGEPHRSLRLIVRNCFCGIDLAVPSAFAGIFAYARLGSRDLSRHRRRRPDGQDEKIAAEVTGAAPGPAGYSPRHPANLVGPGFPAEEWSLLTHLPAKVVLAAVSARAGTAPQTVFEGLAGIEAIAGGRAFDSDLVRAVATAIFAEPDDAGTGRRDAGMAAQDPVRRTGGLADVLASCRLATEVLAARADPADSAAYRQWVQSIAARVCEAARAEGGACAGSGGGSPGAGRCEADPLRAADRRLLRDLGAALSLL